MRPHIVADVGNSRLKWGLCSAAGGSIVDHVSLPEDPAAWETALATWRLQDPVVWAIATVRPERSERLRHWLSTKGHIVHEIRAPEELRLAIDVVSPRRVGIDRLLNAVAAKSHLQAGESAVLVDAGSAVTVDWLDETHTFRGGAIFPGLRLMAEALHRYTAFLPLVTVSDPVPELPAKDTAPAIEAGIFHAVVGGIERMAQALGKNIAQVFLTGGDAALLAPALTKSLDAILWPRQTLEGILIAAEALP